MESQSGAGKDAADASQPHYSTLYFGYGANLSRRILKRRCPHTLFTGMARLDDWKWVIKSHGYANLVRSPGDVVYGSLSFISNIDEIRLDTSEGVPDYYQKLYLSVTCIDTDGAVVIKDGEEQVFEALVYVDETDAETNGLIETDYAITMNVCIRDGIEAGMPSAYADKYLYTRVPRLRDGEEITSIRAYGELEERVLNMHAEAKRA